MSHFITDDAISQFPEATNLGNKDLFVVSKSDGEGGFKQKKVSYSDFSKQISATMGIGELKSQVSRNTSDINALSDVIRKVSSDFDVISARFDVNDEITQTIPEISSQLTSLSSDSRFFQRIDKIVDLSDGEYGLIFRPLDSAVNNCVATQSQMYIRMPNSLSVDDAELSDRSRHFILDVSATARCLPKFSNNCSYFSTQDISQPLLSGSHTMFIFKEISANAMYVQRQDILEVYSGTDMDQLLAAVYYHVNKDSNDYGLSVFEVSADSYLSANEGLRGISSDISANVADGNFFRYLLDLSKPDSPISLQDYAGLFISADMVLSAIYGDRPVFVAYFFGSREIVEEGRVQHPLVDQIYPLDDGQNIYTRQTTFAEIVQRYPEIYLPSGEYFVGWAEDSLSGVVRRPTDDGYRDWTLKHDPEDGPISYYTITEKIDNELSTMLGPIGESKSVKVEDDEPILSSDDIYGTYVQLELDEDDDDPGPYSYMMELIDEDSDTTVDDRPQELMQRLSVDVVKLETHIHVDQ